MKASHDRPSLRLTDTAGLEHLGSGASLEAMRDPIEANQSVLYLRVSTERQMHTAADVDADGNSIATQREATLGKVRALKSTVAEEFVEPGASAQSIAKRPVFRQMLDYIDEHPEVGYVVIYMRSRVFRNFTDAAVTKRALLEKGVRLISAKEHFGEGYAADAMEAMTDVFNEFVVRQSGEDIRTKMLHKVQQGGSVGRAKLGYLNDRKEFDGRLVNTISVDPERAPLIKWAFEAYASGDYTLTQLQGSLADQGLVSRPSVRFPSKVISTSQLSIILHDPYYTGVIRYKGELYPGRHEPLISKELFLRVQDVLAERAKRGQRDRRHHHYLKGLLFCDRCHAAGGRSRLIFTQVTGNGGVYEYFICRGRQERLCDLPLLPVAEVEDAVARRFVLEDLPEGFPDALRAELDEILRDSQASNREMRSNLVKQLRKLDVREERLLDLASDDGLSTPKLKQRLHAVTLERASIQQKLERTEGQLEHGVRTLTAFLDLLAEVGVLYGQSPDPVRRQLVDAIFGELYLEMDDRVEARGQHRPAVEEIHTAAQGYQENQVAIATRSRGQRKDSRRGAGESSLDTSSDLLVGSFRPLGLSKSDLVGVKGLKPSTSRSQTERAINCATPRCVHDER